MIAVHPLRITNGSLKKEAAGLPASPYPDLGLIERTTVTLHQYCLSLGLMEKERHDMTNKVLRTIYAEKKHLNKGKNYWKQDIN